MKCTFMKFAKVYSNVTHRILYSQNSSVVLQKQTQATSLFTFYFETNCWNSGIWSFLLPPNCHSFIVSTGQVHIQNFSLLQNCSYITRSMGRIPPPLPEVSLYHHLYGVVFLKIRIQKTRKDSTSRLKFAGSVPIRRIGEKRDQVWRV